MEIPAEERLYRCEYCHQPVTPADIQKGGCFCGSRRVRIATYVTDEEQHKLKEQGFVFKPEYWMDETTAKQKR